LRLLYQCSQLPNLKTRKILHINTFSSTKGWTSNYNMLWTSNYTIVCFIHAVYDTKIHPFWNKCYKPSCERENYVRSFSSNGSSSSLAASVFKALTSPVGSFLASLITWNQVFQVMSSKCNWLAKWFTGWGTSELVNYVLRLNN
jgi:hypothetical protein